MMGSFVCLALVLCLSATCGNLKLVEHSNANTVKPSTNNNAIKVDDILYYLDISNPSITQPIEPRSDGPEEAKFVQVEVVEVLNPKKYALSFEVHYQPANNAKVYLGVFSLFPADNPGKFIVPTQGKVKNEGAIILSMVIADKVETGEQVKVGVKRLKFLKG